ncbi:MAG: apolipoprotein N-acyltransferase, partial [Deltaproteobacteria bacterium]
MFGLGMAAMSSVRISPLLTILFAPSLWVALEYLRGNMITFGFPWALLGYSQSTFLPLIQIADITGLYGISFLIVMVNAVIFFAMSYWIGKEKKLPVKEGLLVFIVLMVVLIYGLFRISEIDKVSEHWKTLRIAIVQGNIDQGRKWDASFQKQTVDIYRNLSLPPNVSIGGLGMAKQSVRLVIWPETAVPFYLQSDKDLGPEIFNVPKQTNAYLLTGSPAYGPGFGGDVKYYNSAFLISPRGEIIEKYDKIHLVPFGEYVPLKKYLPFIHKLVVGVGDFTPGKWLKPIEFEGNSFGVLICFESIFPELARGFIKDGAGFLINITNDAWFGRTSAPYQHFSQAIFRAVENKVFLIRSANTGISGVIDPVGRVRVQSGIF